MEEINMKYYYQEKEECFKRVDGKGRPLYVNISEARRIDNFIKLGYSVEEIKEKILPLANKKAGRYTVVSIVKNIKEGNVELDGDYAIPETQLNEITDSQRISALEERVTSLEKKMMTENKKSTLDILKNKIGL